MKIIQTFQLKFTILIIGLTFTTASFAQDAKFGLKGGFNFSNLYTKDVDDENLLVGFNGGLFLELPITKQIALMPELLYTTKGAEVKYDNSFFSGAGKFRLNYIEIPVLLKVNLTENFNLHFGPYAAFLVDSKITNEDANGTINFEQAVNKDDLNNFDYGLAAGLGFDFESFGIGARYNYGLNTVGKTKTILGQSYTFPDGKNSVFSLYANIKF